MPIMNAGIARRSFLMSAPFICAGTNANAQSRWAPQQPIRILIGYAPGGAVDILVRIVAEGLQRVRGVSVIPEIRSGAYGFIAAQTAARAAPHFKAAIVANSC